VSELDPLRFDFTFKWETIIAAIEEGYYDQDCSTTRPPLFRGTNFCYWENLMRMFVKTKDYELWNIVTRGPCFPKTMVDQKSAEKTEEQCTQEDFARLSKNFKAMRILYCGL